MSSSNNTASISFNNFYPPNSSSTLNSINSFDWPASRPYEMQKPKNLTESQNYRNPFRTSTFFDRGKITNGFNLRHFNSTHRKIKRTSN